jgi:hypothetical protein
MDLPIYKLSIDELDFESGIDFISLVENPAIQKNFIAFNKIEFLQPTQGETKKEFIPKCIKYVIDEGKDSEQAVAICNSMWDNKNFAQGDKVSFDYDDTLSTAHGKELAKQEIESGSTVYIISARHNVEGMLSVANDLGIAESRVYATGSNSAKVEKIKELGITKHYDNNQDVIDEIGSVGAKFDIIVKYLPNYIKQIKKIKTKFESYNDYPEAVKNNAQKVLKYTEENGWGSCGTDVGKQRANQLAKGENISMDTIQRMYSYLSRHKVDLKSSKSYDDGCGMLMYDSWGGEEALRWAESKLNKTKFAIQNEEKRIITGAAMYSDLPIYRRDEEKGEYYVVFDKETIFKIAKKWALNNKYNAVNTDHKQPIEGCTLFESYLLDFERGIMPPKGFEDAKDGSWFVSYLVESDTVWAKCKDGTWNGFSVEGFFNFTINAEIQFLSQLKDILQKHIKNATKNT